MSVELATAWIKLVPSAKGIEGQLGKELGVPLDRQGIKSGKSMGAKLVDGIGKTIKRGVKAVGLAGGAVLGTALFKGFQRLDQIDTARKKMEGLGHDTKTVDTIMSNALASVKGTAFGLGDAAGLAGTIVASGIKPGAELEKTLKRVADSAATAGTDLGDMGRIWAKAAAKGRIDGRTINQMLERQIPILEMLGTYYGKTAEEVEKMVSRGEVSFEDFSNAMDQHFAGAALKSGETFRGSLANMIAALGRLGALALGKVFPQFIGLFQGITGLLDGFEKQAERVGIVAGHAFEYVVTGATNLGKAIHATASQGGALHEKMRAATEALQTFAASDQAASMLDALKNVMGAIGRNAADLIPAVAKLGESIAVAVAQIGFSTWDLFVGALNLAAGALDTLVPLVAGLTEWLADHQWIVTGLVAGYTAWFTATKLIAFASIIKGLAAATIALKANTIAWVTNRTAAAASMAQTVAIMGMYATDAVRTAARATAAWVASAARTVASLAATAAGFVAQGAVMVASMAATAASVVAGWVTMGLQAMLGAAKIALAWAIAFWPVALVVAAVVAAAALIIANWDKIKEWASIAASAIAATWQAFVDWFKGIWETLTGWWDSIWAAITATFEMYWAINVAILEAAWAVIQAIFTTAFNAIKTIVTTYWNTVRTITMTVWNAVVAFVTGIPARIMAGLQALANLGAKAREWFGKVKTAAVDKFNDVVTWVTGVPGRILSALGDLSSLLYDAGVQVLAGFLSGLKKKWEDIKDFIGGIGRWIKDHKGPRDYDLALLVPAGGWIMTGLQEGLESGYPSIARSLQDFTENLALGASVDLTTSAGPQAFTPTVAVTGGGETTINLRVDASDLDDLQTIQDFLERLKMQRVTDRQTERSGSVVA